MQYYYNRLIFNYLSPKIKKPSLQCKEDLNQPKPIIMKIPDKDNAPNFLKQAILWEKTAC